MQKNFGSGNSTIGLNNNLYAGVLTNILTFLLLLSLVLFPTNSYAVRMEKVALSIPVENRVFLYSSSENTLTEASGIYLARNPTFYQIEMNSNDFLIIYSYAYGDVINTMPENNSDGIESIAISLHTLDANGEILETKLENYILPNKKCNIFKTNNLEKGTYQLTIHTTTIANEYSDFFSYGTESGNVTIYFFEVVEP